MHRSFPAVNEVGGNSKIRRVPPRSSLERTVGPNTQATGEQHPTDKDLQRNCRADGRIRRLCGLRPAAEATDMGHLLKGVVCPSEGTISHGTDMRGALFLFAQAFSLCSHYLIV